MPGGSARRRCPKRDEDGAIDADEDREGDEEYAGIGLVEE
jgi:hypothetical protein